MKNSANSHGWVNPRDIEDIWKVCNPLPPFCSAYAHSPRFLQDHFDYYYREFDEFIFPMTIHPDVSGRPHVLLMHERYVFSVPLSPKWHYTIVLVHYHPC